MKRWIAAWTAALMLSVPSVCSAGSEVRLSTDGDARRAEVWLDGQLLFRLVIADAVPTWTGEGGEKTVWFAPRTEGGMLKIIVR